jgi:hypothetical protein
MSKPEDIPQDVWDTAIRVATTSEFTERVKGIARTILAAKAEEREACARIAEDQDGGAIECEQIASAIRKRGEG